MLARTFMYTPVAMVSRQGAQTWSIGEKLNPVPKTFGTKNVVMATSSRLVNRSLSLEFATPDTTVSVANQVNQHTGI